MAFKQFFKAIAYGLTLSIAWSSACGEAESSDVTKTTANRPVEKRGPVTNAIAEYRDRREETESSVETLRELAEWCSNYELNDEARAHYLAAARIAEDFDEQAELRRLAGDIPDQLGWRSPTQVTADNAIALSRRRTLDLYADDFREHRRSLEQAHHSEQGRIAREALQTFRGPHAAWLIGEVFHDATRHAAEAALAAMENRRSVEATRVLARWAVDAADRNIRETSAKLLADRERSHFVPQLLDRLHTPLEVTKIRETGSDLRRQTVWVVTSETRRARKKASLTSTAELRLLPIPMRREVVNTGRGLAFNTAVAAQLNAMQSDVDELSSRTQRGLEAKAQSAVDRNTRFQIKRLRTQVEEENERVIAALKRSLRKDSPAQTAPKELWDWWQTYNGMAKLGDSATKQLLEISASESPVYEQPMSEIAELSEIVEFIPGSSCFAAGTPVWTDRGPLPIETLQTGDRVLTFDFTTGQKTMGTVLYPTVRTTDEKYDLRFGDETIRSSAAHPLWDLIRGWQRVRHLAGGEILKTATDTIWLEQIAPLERNDPAIEAPVYNLVVDQTHTYYVGKCQLLVHDDTVPVPRNAEDIFVGLAESSFK